MKHLLRAYIFFFTLLAWGERGWTTFEGCTLIQNPSNDGDSFHVRYKHREYIFRLYFVDCPETDTRFPERLKEQSASFNGLSEKEVIRAGKKAASFTARWLDGGEFTVHTRYQDAQGNSKKKRYYAWIEKDDKNLAEELVRSGYARVYGVKTDPPGAVTERQFVMRLHTLEKEAQRNRKGAWAFSSATATSSLKTPNPPVEQKEIQLARPVMARHPEPPNLFYMMLQAGQQITVIETATGSFLQIQWVTSDGKEHTGVVLRSDLGL